MTQENHLVVAVPVEDELLATHFGHCSTFMLFVVERGGKTVVETKSLPAPPHEPGKLPGWLSEQGVHTVLAGGIGSRAIQLFSQAGIDVVSGCPIEVPEKVVQSYLERTLEPGKNQCDH